MNSSLRWLFLALLVIWFPACGPSYGNSCRQSDDCGGDAFCCNEPKCGGGLCTTLCVSDRDCPGDMYCRDAKCFFSCESDRDCEPPFGCHEKDGRLMCIVN